MPAKNTKYVVALGGPTAVGKSALAVGLAKHFKTAIVSADSRQMYRQMTIGTAKPGSEELKAVPHYFIDHLDIAEEYSVGRFEKEALEVLRELHLQHDIVFLVGGSGLYLKAVLAGLDRFPPVPDQVREQWESNFQQHGLTFLQQQLAERDPDYYAVVDRQNPRRLTRALSIIEASGRPFSSFLSDTLEERPFASLRIFCNLDRSILYEHINSRVEEMMNRGLESEARKLYLNKSLKALQTVGYQELFDYFDGKWTLDEAITKIRQHSRNYAKRQVTWFRNQGEWTEFNPPDEDAIAQYIINNTP